MRQNKRDCKVEDKYNCIYTYKLCKRKKFIFHVAIYHHLSIYTCIYSIYDEKAFVNLSTVLYADRYEDMFQFQDGMIDESDGEEVEVMSSFGSSPIFCVNLSRSLVMALLAFVKVTDLGTRFGSPE